MKYQFIRVKNSEYSKIIYEINNDLSVRKFSKNPNQFTFDRHKVWLKTIFKKNNEKIFLIKFKNKFIGVIRSKKKRIRDNLSWALKKKFRNLGHGKNFLKKFTKKNIKFSATIHEKNISSIKIAYFSGFKIKNKNSHFLNMYKN